MAAAGLTAMLIGALLAFAPAPVGAQHETSLERFYICHSTSSSANPYVINRPAISAQGALNTGQGDHTTHTGPVYTGQASGWGDIIPPYTWEGGSSPGLNWDAGHDIHENGCNLLEGEDPKASLTVVKKVTGAVPATWAASVTVDDGVGGMDPKVAALTGTSSVVTDSEQYAALDPGTYSVTETVGGGTFAGGVCTDDTDGDAVIATAFANAADLSGELTLEEDDAVTCTFTNHYPSEIIIITTTTTAPPVASLQIVKAVTGDAPESWSNSFGGDLGVFALTNVSPSNTEVDLPVGSYTVSEVDADESELVDIDCTGADAVVDLAEGSVTVDLEADDTARCTFTNNYPEVEPNVVTTTEPPTTTEKPAEVLPDVVVRPTTLPRTGNEAGTLAGLGIALMVFGGVLVGASRKGLLRS